MMTKRGDFIFAGHYKLDTSAHSRACDQQHGSGYDAAAAAGEVNTRGACAHVCMFAWASVHLYTSDRVMHGCEKARLFA